MGLTSRFRTPRGLASSGLTARGLSFRGLTSWCLRFIGVMSRGLTRVLRLMGLTASGLIFWGSYATFLDRRFTYPGVLQPGILISRGVN